MNDNDTPATSAPETVETPAPVVETPTPANDNPNPAKAGETPKEPTLEEAMAQVDLGALTDKQLADLESGDPAKVRSALGLKDAPPASPDAPDAPTAPAAAGDGVPHRVSVKALPEAARVKLVKAIDLVRAGKTPEEAMAEMFGITQPAATPAAKADPEPGQEPETPAAPAAPAVPDMVKSIQDKIEAKKAEIKAVKAEYGDTDELLLELGELNADLREAKREAEKQAAVEADFNAKQAASHARAMDKYSELITEGPEFLEYCDAEIVLAERRNDPMLNSPDWPEKIGQRVADKYFKGRVAQSSPSGEGKSTSQIPPAPKNSVRLPGSPVGPGFASGSLSPDTAAAEIEKLTPEQQDALLLELDKQTSTRR